MQMILLCNEMKKPLYKRYSFWIVIVVVMVAGIFFFGARREENISANDSVISPSFTPSAENEQSVRNDSEEYAFNVPDSWYVENSGENTVVVYPDYAPTDSSSSPTCKIEMSVFPYASSTSISDWISGRLGADPTVNVVEQSSEHISIDDGNESAIKWIGTMNGIPTTLVYAFGESHAYEIAPSVVSAGNDEGADASANATCNDNLNIFLQTLTI